MTMDQAENRTHTDMTDGGAPEYLPGAPARLAWPDWIRGAAMVAVISIHLSGVAGFPDNPLLLWLNSFAMAIFFFVSGNLMRNSRKCSAAEYARRKAAVILWPYLTFSACAVLFDYAVLRLRGESITGELIKLWLRCVFTLVGRGTLWFLPVFYFACVLAWSVRERRIPAVLLFLAWLGAMAFMNEIFSVTVAVLTGGGDGIGSDIYLVVIRSLAAAAIILEGAWLGPVLDRLAVSKKRRPGSTSLLCGEPPGPGVLPHGFPDRPVRPVPLLSSCICRLHLPPLGSGKSGPALRSDVFREKFPHTDGDPPGMVRRAYRLVRRDFHYRSRSGIRGGLSGAAPCRPGPGPDDRILPERRHQPLSFLPASPAEEDFILNCSKRQPHQVIEPGAAALYLQADFFPGMYISETVSHDLLHDIKRGSSAAVACYELCRILLQLLRDRLDLPDLIVPVSGTLHQMEAADGQIGRFPVLVHICVHYAQDPVVSASRHQDGLPVLVDHQAMLMAKIVLLIILTFAYKDPPVRKRKRMASALYHKQLQLVIDPGIAVKKSHLRQIRDILVDTYVTVPLRRLRSIISVILPHRGLLHIDEGFIIDLYKGDDAA